jgi:hypothetical protein
MWLFRFSYITKARDHITKNMSKANLAYVADASFNSLPTQNNAVISAISAPSSHNPTSRVLDPYVAITPTLGTYSALEVLKDL